MRKSIKIIALIITIFLVLPLISTVVAYSNIQPESNNTNQNSEYGRAYQEWLKLTQKEKSKVLEPSKYDIPFSSLVLGGSDGEEEELEEYYNLAEIIDIEVEDQGQFGLCWAFASTKSLETNIALTQGEYYDFSEMHLGQLTAGLEGGNFSMANGYWTTMRGPVLEEYVEYREYEESELEYLNSLSALKQVEKIVYFPTIYKDTATEYEIEETRKAIKKHIINNGSVCASIKIAATQEEFENDTENKQYFNSETNALYYNGEELSDHLISIVGWDDNYSKTNFIEGNQPENDGAYIALNSWGKQWGNDGYFYISYEDVLVETDVAGVANVNEAYIITREGWSIENSNDYSEISIEEIRNLAGIESEEDSLWIQTIPITNSNIENSYLEKIGILAKEGASCEIYVKSEQIEVNSDEEYTLLASMENLQEGYNIIELDTKQKIKNEVNIYIKYEGDSIYVSEEILIGDLLPTTVFGDSIEGNWKVVIGEYKEEEDTSSIGYDFPIEFFKTEKSNYIELGSITPTNKIDITEIDTVFEIPLSVQQREANSVNIKITSKGEEVTELFTIGDNELDEFNSTILKISLNENIQAGTYLIAISYPNSATLYKAITITEIFSIGEVTSAFWWDEVPYWYYNVNLDIYDDDVLLNSENVKILYEGLEVTDKIYNIECFKDESSTYGSITFERKIEDELISGTYSVMVEYGGYSDTVDFTIGEDQITQIRQYEGEEESYFDLGADYVIKIINLETQEEILVNGADYDESKFANLENNKCYELRIYRSSSVVDRLKFSYYNYARIFIYKDNEGNKYFRTTANGENLEQATMINCLSNGGEDETSYIEMSVEDYYGVILLKDMTTDDIWIDGALMTYNTMETSMLKCTKEEFIRNAYLVDETQEIRILNENGTELMEDKYIGTGMNVQYGDRVWELIVTGDIDGNGALSSTDLSKLCLHIVEAELLQNAYKIAADFNEDGKVSLIDLAQIKEHLVKSE